MLQYKLCAIYHHGSVTDNLFKAGKYEELKDRLSIIRDHGMPAGLGTHMPEVVRYAQEHDWGVDFYVTSVYNLSLEQDRVSSAITGKANTGERFKEEDIPVMYKTVRSVDKPCLVFKILGASRRCGSQESVRNAFSEAFENIKDTDAVVVGVYPKNEDQPVHPSGHRAGRKASQNEVKAVKKGVRKTQQPDAKRCVRLYFLFDAI